MPLEISSGPEGLAGDDAGALMIRIGCFFGVGFLIIIFCIIYHVKNPILISVQG